MPPTTSENARSWSAVPTPTEVRRAGTVLQFLSRPLVLIVALLLACPAPGAAQAREVADRKPADREAIAEVEAWLNGLTTLRANFVQNDNQGNSAAGTLHLSKPGLMRFEYEPPSPLLLVANGVFLVVIDHELRQVSNIPLSHTPLAVLTAGTVDLERDYRITDIRSEERVREVTLRSRDDPDAGFLRLSFSRSPTALRQWLVRDAQGVEVRVSLFRVTRGIRLDRRLFTVDPTMYDDHGSGDR